MYGKGSYSNVYKIGEKIIKIGAHQRTTEEIPYHKRILQPLLRRSVKDDDGTPDGKFLFHMEASEEVDTERHIPIDEVYKVYKELRDDGIIWTDPKADNLGRLKKDNVVHFEGIEEVDSASVGFAVDIPKDREILKKGELVIIDTDFLYREGDPNIVIGNEHHYKYYEERYQKEKAQEQENGKSIINSAVEAGVAIKDGQRLRESNKLVGNYENAVEPEGLSNEN